MLNVLVPVYLFIQCCCQCDISYWPSPFNCVHWREQEERGTHPLASVAFFSTMTGSHLHGGSCTENRLVYTCFFLEGE